MVRVNDHIIGTYRDGDFYVDICLRNEFEAWIYHKNYGIKLFMFGVPSDGTTVNEFFELVEDNVKFWINEYKALYCFCEER